MGMPRRVDAFVRRLEDSIDSAVSGRERAVLSYSAGLASLLVAVIARKRCTLRCIVVGAEASPDIDAAAMTRQVFDFNVEVIHVDAHGTRRAAATVAADHPDLTKAERTALIPLDAVLERVTDPLVLAGFGVPRLRHVMIDALARRRISLPLVKASRGRSLDRAALRAAARLLGLPLSWVNVKHRAPASGAGIEDFLHRKDDAMR